MYDLLEQSATLKQSHIRSKIDMDVLPDLSQQLPLTSAV